MEKERRKNNVIITGLGKEIREDKGKMEGWIKSRLGVGAKINSKWKVGVKRGEGELE